MIIRVKLPLIIILILLAAPASGSLASCAGRFINPVSDICWRCLLPISIGDFSFGKGGVPANRDIKNPVSPVGVCTRQGVPTPGIVLGFWEPIRMIDVTRTPYCMVGLGGIEMGSEKQKISSYNRAYSKKRTTNYSFYHLHYYIYPVIYWLELITDLVCLEKGTFDVAYMSELDPTWNDPKLQTLLNPEVFLFTSPPAQAACAMDCASATVSFPIDTMFWCAGCLGNMYPLSGANADHIGGVQNSSLLAVRIINKMHRLGLARETSTTDSSINGKLCRKNTMLRIKKSQYKLQMLYPKSSSGSIGCWPLGMTDMEYNSGREYPNGGEDWSYLLFRKKNCVAF